MDGQRFDRLTRSLASGASRRSLLKGLLGLGGAAALDATTGSETTARTQGSRPRPDILQPPPETTTTPAPPTTLPPPDPCEGYPATCAIDGCCNGACTDRGRCCPTGMTICGEDCCATIEQCCDGECCPDGTICYDGQRCCPPSLFCGGVCCTGTGQQCCGEVCLQPGQCCDVEDCADSPATCQTASCDAANTCQLSEPCADAEPGTVCCDQACVPLGDTANCQFCGDACGPGQLCTEQGCVSPTTTTPIPPTTTAAPVTTTTPTPTTTTIAPTTSTAPPPTTTTPEPGSTTTGTPGATTTAAPATTTTGVPATTTTGQPPATTTDAPATTTVPTTTTVRPTTTAPPATTTTLAPGSTTTPVPGTTTTTAPTSTTTTSTTTSTTTTAPTPVLLEPCETDNDCDTGADQICLKGGCVNLCPDQQDQSCPGDACTCRGTWGGSDTSRFWWVCSSASTDLACEAHTDCPPGYFCEWPSRTCIPACLPCTSNEECDDGELCTQNICEPSQGCINPPIENCCVTAADCTHLGHPDCLQCDMTNNQCEYRQFARCSCGLGQFGSCFNGECGSCPV